MYRSSILFFCLLALCWSCQKNSHKAPDVSDVAIQTPVVRFDSILYSMRTTQDLEKVMAAYPSFSDLYFHRILNLKRHTLVDSLFHTIRNMVKSEAFTVIGRMGHNQYDQIDDIKRDWRQAMQYYAHYFETDEVPDLYTTVTEFAFGSFIFPIDQDKDGIGVSVDLFLGDSINYPAMAKIDASFSAYNSRTFNRDHLVKKAVDALIDDVVPAARGAEFLPHLLREAKKYYISDILLPFVSDTVVWEYTPAQLDWVRQNEWNIYSFLIANELFYSKDRAKYIRLITPSPSTPDMPPEAPGRAVIYIGYKIVERYMERHPEVTLAQLAGLDAHTLFQEAKYKPEK